MRRSKTGSDVLCDIDPSQRLHCMGPGRGEILVYSMKLESGGKGPMLGLIDRGSDRAGPWLSRSVAIVAAALLLIPIAASAQAASGASTDPAAEQQTLTPVRGETVRIGIDARSAGVLSRESPIEVTFLAFQEDNIVVADLRTERRMAVPFSGVTGFQVMRDHPANRANIRGALAAGAFGTGMWFFLRILCRSGCDNGLGSAWFPAAATGVAVGLMVKSRGPGSGWRDADLPQAATGLKSVDVGFSLTLPAR